MKLTPSSVARRRTASADAGSLGGPQIPSPVIRMAPNPRRLTVSSPPNETVPLETASGLFSFLFMFLLQSILLGETRNNYTNRNGCEVTYKQAQINNLVIQNQQNF